MIIEIPDAPLLDGQGRPKPPVCLLLGGQRGSWQAGAARELDRLAASVIRTAVPAGPGGVISSAIHVSCCRSYLAFADVIVIWTGAGSDGLYLGEWLIAAEAIAVFGPRVILGIRDADDHPMALYLAALGSAYLGVSAIRSSVSDLIGAAGESLRKARP